MQNKFIEKVRSERNTESFAAWREVQKEDQPFSPRNYEAAQVRGVAVVCLFFVGFGGGGSIVISFYLMLH
jgi:hypothetical protein